MACKENRTSFLEREFRMVLVGKTGVGKSATGNTICGAGKGAQIFKAFARAMSVTQKCKQHSFHRFDYDLQLVDVPGFCDTSKSDKDIQKEIMKCVAMSSPGIHAILFIVRIGRFTEEDISTLERFLRCFGKEAKSFVIVVFTGKDDLEEDGDGLDNYIGDCPVALKQFLYEAKLRFIAVNNRGTNEQKEKFTKDLIKKVKNMVVQNGGRCYTDEMYERCEADLLEAEKDEKLEGERQKEFGEKCQLEAAALEEQLQSQRLQMQELEKQLEEERKSRERDQEDQLKERLKALEDAQREQTEIHNRKIEELRREEIRKQIREKVENEDTSYLGRFVQWCGSWFQ